MNEGSLQSDSQSATKKAVARNFPAWEDTTLQLAT